MTQTTMDECELTMEFTQTLPIAKVFRRDTNTFPVGMIEAYVLNALHQDKPRTGKQFKITMSFSENVIDLLIEEPESENSEMKFSFLLEHGSHHMPLDIVYELISVIHKNYIKGKSLFRQLDDALARVGGAHVRIKEWLIRRQ